MYYRITALALASVVFGLSCAPAPEADKRISTTIQIPSHRENDYSQFGLTPTEDETIYAGSLVLFDDPSVEEMTQLLGASSEVRKSYAYRADPFNGSKVTGLKIRTLEQGLERLKTSTSSGLSNSQLAIAASWVEDRLQGATEQTRLSSQEALLFKSDFATYCEAKVLELALHPPLAHRTFRSRPSPMLLCEGYYQDNGFFEDDDCQGSNGSYYQCIWKGAAKTRWILDSNVGDNFTTMLSSKTFHSFLKNDASVYFRPKENLTAAQIAFSEKIEKLSHEWLLSFNPPTRITKRVGRRRERLTVTQEDCAAALHESLNPLCEVVFKKPDQQTPAAIIETFEAITQTEGSLNSRFEVAELSQLAECGAHKPGSFERQGIVSPYNIHSFLRALGRRYWPRFGDEVRDSRGDAIQQELIDARKTPLNYVEEEGLDPKTRNTCLEAALPEIFKKRDLSPQEKANQLELSVEIRKLKESLASDTTRAETLVNKALAIANHGTMAHLFFTFSLSARQIDESLTLNLKFDKPQGQPGKPTNFIGCMNLQTGASIKCPASVKNNLEGPEKDIKVHAQNPDDAQAITLVIDLPDEYPVRNTFPVANKKEGADSIDIFETDFNTLAAAVNKPGAADVFNLLDYDNELMDRVLELEMYPNLIHTSLKSELEGSTNPAELFSIITGKVFVKTGNVESFKGATSMYDTRY